MCYAQALPSALQVTHRLLYPVQQATYGKLLVRSLLLIIDFSGQIMTYTSEKSSWLFSNLLQKYKGDSIPFSQTLNMGLDFTDVFLMLFYHLVGLYTEVGI